MDYTGYNIEQLITQIKRTMKSIVGHKKTSDTNEAYRLLREELIERSQYNKVLNKYLPISIRSNKTGDAVEYSFRDVKNDGSGLRSTRKNLIDDEFIKIEELLDQDPNLGVSLRATPIETNLFDLEIIDNIRKSLHIIEDTSSIKDHIRNGNYQEKHYRDHIKNYIDDRNGFKSYSENISKKDNFSDVRVARKNLRRTISLKIWKRNQNRDAIKQLVDEMGDNIIRGFLVMVSNTKDKSIIDDYKDRFCINHLNAIKNTIEDVISGEEINIFSSKYSFNGIEYTITHIVYETKQFLK